jgi:hypothetical protein
MLCCRTRRSCRTPFLFNKLPASRLLSRAVACCIAPETLTNDLSLHAPDLPQVWGTADCITFEFGRVDGVIDLKFGVGVVVDPETPQLAIYALLAAQHFGMSATGITVTIVQPRLGLLRSHHYSPEALDRFEQTLRAAVAAAEQPDAPRHAGSWCWFCPATGTCPEHQRMSLVPAPSIWRRSAAMLRFRRPA